MKFDLQQSVREKIFTVAHRGVAGGNIPCNTMAAYEIALQQGADMIEIDLDRTADGTLVIFHPEMERPQLGMEQRISQLTWEEVKQLRYLNGDDVPTQFGIETFDDVLEALRGRCYINADKFWGAPKEIAKTIRRHGMADQVLVKSAPSPAVEQILGEVAPEIAYMPIIRSADGVHEAMMRSGLNYVGCEILFYSDRDPQVSCEFLNRLHQDGKVAWVNAIVYDHKEQIAAGHSDDLSLLGHPEQGWGWLVDRGFDMIQTDWPAMMIDYLKKVGKYYK